MRIGGLQKVTLLDYPGHVACTVFMQGCGFRCPFCHNAALVLPGLAAEEVAEDEVFRYLEKRRGVITGVCVSGGEPLMQEGIIGFLVKLRGMGMRIKVDTNGSRPDVLNTLLEQGLADYVAMDIKNTPEKYALTVGVPGLDLAGVRDSVALLKEGRTAYEFRTTVVREYHSIDDVEGIAKWIEGADLYCLQAFEDSGQLIAPGLSAVPEEELRRMAEAARQYVKQVMVRGI